MLFGFAFVWVYCQDGHWLRQSVHLKYIVSIRALCLVLDTAHDTAHDTRHTWSATRRTVSVKHRMTVIESRTVHSAHTVNVHKGRRALDFRFRTIWKTALRTVWTESTIAMVPTSNGLLHVKTICLTLKNCYVYGNSVYFKV